MTITLDIANLSKEIHLAIKTIRSTLVNNPKALPPRLVIPGQKRLLWLREDVENFYRSQVKGHGSNPDFSPKQPEQPEQPEQLKQAGAKKRGRPTKAAQMAERQAAEKKNGSSK